MKINKLLQSVKTISVRDGIRRADVALNPNSESENNVHLSTNVTKLQNIDSDSNTSTARVQEIKQAISEGNFQINPEVIADRLLKTVKELIQSKKGAI